ncbi:hypothetical protein N1851_027839 [Merluccius polli]|uniref:Uncharacterized protein n=1 Tax=Merluccius polli TaxID=89951 RepID=A0AA47MA16_MERPO|nr:hypothetical protein N1851_027839 [Merluccius polli]
MTDTADGDTAQLMVFGKVFNYGRGFSHRFTIKREEKSDHYIQGTGNVRGAFGLWALCRCWLSRGKVLQQFVYLPRSNQCWTHKIRSMRNCDDAWLPDLCFLTDITAKLSFATSFREKDNVCVWASQLRNGRLVHFPNLEKMLRTKMLPFLRS